MDVQTSTLWWLAAGALVAAELASGTFYLLMLALGVACGAVAAHLGAGFSAQLITASVIGGGAVVLWHRHRGRQPQAAAGLNRDVILDVGETVEVERWLDNGTTHVQYRGAAWQARLASPGAGQPGRHRIQGIDGIVLLLEPLPG